MGFFDDFNNFVGEISSIRSEVANFKNDFVEELNSEVTDVTQTINGTASDVRQTAVEMTETVRQTTSLTPPTQQIFDDNVNAE